MKSISDRDLKFRDQFFLLEVSARTFWFVLTIREASEIFAKRMVADRIVEPSHELVFVRGRRLRIRSKEVNEREKR
jgi:hypothetical protein